MNAPTKISISPEILSLLVGGTESWLSDAASRWPEYEEAVRQAKLLLHECPVCVAGVPLVENAGYMHVDGYPVIARFTAKDGWHFERIGSASVEADATKIASRIMGISDVPINPTSN